jgi:hypothetical protein
MTTIGSSSRFGVHTEYAGQHPNFPSAALALLMLVGAVLGCQSSNAAIDPILDAKTEQEADKQLRIHGPIRAEEVRYIYKATSSSEEHRRRNAAGLLTATLKGNADELRHKALMETKDVFVWAILLKGLLDKEPELAGQRPDMIKEALAEDDPDTLAVGLRAGALANYPGIHELARKHLDHANDEVRTAAVGGLTPEDVNDLLPKLKEMILKEDDQSAFTILGKLLIHNGDAGAAEAVINALARAKEARNSLDTTFFNNLAVFTEPDPVFTKFLFVLVRSKSPIRDDGFSVFSRWVWSTEHEPQPEFVKICVDEIEKGNLSTDPRRRPEVNSEQNECELMLSYMHNGNNPIHDFAGRTRGSDAVAFAKKWLQDHGG